MPIESDPVCECIKDDSCFESSVPSLEVDPSFDPRYIKNNLIVIKQVKEYSAAIYNGDAKERKKLSQQLRKLAPSIIGERKIRQKVANNFFPENG